jgi:hypothetical protein
MITNVRAALTTGLLTCLLAASAASAAGPVRGGFSYHGQLIDNGVPADGQYDIEFALYADASGGLPIDVIRSDATELHDGVLDAPLDFIGVAADGSGRWVEVRMRKTGSSEAYATLSPRQSLNAATSSHKGIGTVSGAAHAYDLAFVPDTLIGNSTVLLGNINVPAGSYVAFVRMQVRTGGDPPGNSFRLDCNLGPGFDNGVYRVGTETNAERYVTFQGGATLGNAGPIQFSCQDGNGHTQTLLSGKLTVIAVDAIN